MSVTPEASARAAETRSDRLGRLDAEFRRGISYRTSEDKSEGFTRRTASPSRSPIKYVDIRWPEIKRFRARRRRQPVKATDATGRKKKTKNKRGKDEGRWGEKDDRFRACDNRTHSGAVEQIDKKYETIKQQGRNARDNGPPNSFQRKQPSMRRSLGSLSAILYLRP